MNQHALNHDHARCTGALLSRAEALCARRGARFTAQRRDVLACVAQSHVAAGAYEIIERMAARGARPSPISVYRALEFLRAHDLVHKIESRNAFIACSEPHDGKPAALLICTGCGNVAEVEAAELARSLAGEAERRGFKPDRLIVELSGLCGHCG